MKVRLARKAGFCMGVRRAMRLALKAAETSSRPVYTYGPLIHNPQALELLERLGVRDLKKTKTAPEGVVIIRAHGVPPEEKEALAASGLEVIDGTCPRVARVQALARKYSREGYQVIVIGDRDHAEVRGILGYTGGRGVVVESFGDLEGLPPLKRYVILSQTTQDEEIFELLSREILSRYPGGKVINTICHATHVRQESVRELARECPAIVVVGGRGSANTNRLVQIAGEEGARAFLVETPEELPLAELARYPRVGVSAGASTPNWLINGVVERLAAHGNPLRHLLRALLYLHVPLALSAVLLLAGGFLILGKTPPLSAAVLVFLMVFFAHTWNSLVAREVLALCHPYKAAFYRKREKFLVSLSLGAFSGALLMGYRLGPQILMLVAILGGISALYSLTSLRGLFPGNRPLFITLYWIVLMGSFLVPSSPPGLPGFVLLGLIVLAVFFQILYLDLLDLFEDGFLGRESMAAWLGENRTLKLLMALPIPEVLLILGMVFSAGWKFLILLGVPFLQTGITFFLRRKPLGRRVSLEYLGLSPSLLFLTLSLLVVKI